MQSIPWLTGSSNSSKYFASNDSSDTSRKARKSQEAPAEHQHSFDTPVENPLWSRIQHTPERVMMTYQIHTRYRPTTTLTVSISVMMSKNQMLLLRHHTLKCGHESNISTRAEHQCDLHLKSPSFGGIIYFKSNTQIIFYLDYTDYTMALPFLQYVFPTKLAYFWCWWLKLYFLLF